mgnify:CR=1 FL=1
MENLIWIIYLIDTVLPALSLINTWLFSIVVVTGLFYIIFRLIFSDGTWDKSNKQNLDKLAFRWRRWYLAGIVIVLLLSFTPNSDTAYKMLAVYGVNELAQIEEVQKVGSKGIAVINKVLDSYLLEDTEIITEK